MIIRLRTYLFALLVFMSLSSLIIGSSEPGIAGISSDSTSVWCLYKGHVICQDINTNNVRLDKDLHANPEIVNALYEKSISLYQLKGAAVLQETKDAIEKFTAINITCYQQKIFVGVRFRAGVSGSVASVAVRYAVLEFDKSLRFNNYYMFCLTKQTRFFTLPPFYELNFVDTATVALPLRHEGKYNICKLKLNKNHEVRLMSVMTGDLGIIGMMHLYTAEGIVASPNYYEVKHSANTLFYQYPFPVFHSAAKIAAFDPYELRPTMERLGKINHFNDYTTELWCMNMDYTLSRHVLASLRKNDTLFAVVGGSKPGQPGEVDCLSWNIKSGAYKKKPLKLPAGDTYFYFTDEHVFTLIQEKGNITVKSSDIATMFR